MTIERIPYRSIMEVSAEELNSIASRREGSYNVKHGEKLADLCKVQENEGVLSSLLSSSESTVISAHPYISNFEPNGPTYGITSYHEEYDEDAERLAKRLDTEFDDIDIILSEK